MDKERFNKALTHLLEASGTRLTLLQTRYLDAVRDGFNEFSFGEKSGNTTIQTIAAACMAVSNNHGDVLFLGFSGRQIRAWLELVQKWLAFFEQHPDFGFVITSSDAREHVTTHRKDGSHAKISAYPVKSSANLRGMGERTRLLLADVFELERMQLIPVILPLIANGASCVITRIQPRVKRVYTTIDPTPSGTTTIVSTTYRDGVIEYVGGDKTETVDLETLATFLQGYVKRIRENIMGCSSVHFEFSIESNMAGLSPALEHRVLAKEGVAPFAFVTMCQSTKLNKEMCRAKLRAGHFTIHPAFVSLESSTEESIEAALAGNENDFFIVCALNAYQVAIR